VTRKIIQICAIATPDTPDVSEKAHLFALCDDGTVWAMNLKDEEKYRHWKVLAFIPQGKP
jgi:hypothetical protein